MIMNKEFAGSILEACLRQFRKYSYEELKLAVEGKISKTEQAVDQSGNSYQIEIQVFWDDKPGGCIRVLGSVDDGGRSAFVPFTRDFIMSPDGSFVGE
jgi:hypothetical protein